MLSINTVFDQIKGFYQYKLGSDISIFYIFSTMRSGSTLLKSLLLVNMDLPYYKEINIYNKGNKYLSYNKIYKQGRKGKVVAKKPSSLSDYTQYPSIHRFRNEKYILLFREPNQIYHSVQNMMKDLNRVESQGRINEYILVTFENLIQFYEDNKPNSTIVFYDDLIESPNKILNKLLSFLGVDFESIKLQYEKNLNKSSWGYDDISSQFNSGSIVKHKKELVLNINSELLEMYEQIKREYSEKA